MRGLPDLVIKPNFLFSDGDRVVARWNASGTQKGSKGQVAAFGSNKKWNGNTIFRIACGRIAEEGSESDAIAFFKQFGAQTHRH